MCFVECHADCLGGCSTKGAASGLGYCDAICKINYRLSDGYQCERKCDSLSCHRTNYDGRLCLVSKRSRAVLQS